MPLGQISCTDDQKLSFLRMSAPRHTSSKILRPMWDFPIKKKFKHFESFLFVKTFKLPICSMKSAENPLKNLIKYFPVNIALPNSFIRMKTTNLANNLRKQKLLDVDDTTTD